jgi:heme A synthase
MTRAIQKRSLIVASLIGCQGLLGWYMVKSGLDAALLDNPHAIPRVSQYRLAAHLGTAFTIYAFMLTTGLGILRANAPKKTLDVCTLPFFYNLGSQSYAGEPTFEEI